MNVSVAPRLPDAHEVASQLNAHVEALAAELLPAGRRKSGYWTCGGVGGEAGGSLFIHLTGGKRGRWQDAATGEFGDMLDLLAACRWRGDKKAAYADGLRWLGLDTRPGRAPSEPRPAPPPVPDDKAAAFSARAKAMWRSAKKDILDTPLDAYLLGRNIDLRLMARLGHVPRALRFEPRLWHDGAKMHFPAMVAAIVNGAGQHVATHRTWLEYAGGGWIKARIFAASGKPDNKKVLGGFRGGSIHLWRGTSGKPIKEAPAGDLIAIAEGIETALSVALLVPHVRVLSGISLGNLANVDLPENVGLVTLIVDNDDKPEPQIAAARVQSQWIARGFKVRAARSPIGKDFNDLLRAFPIMGGTNDG